MSFHIQIKLEIAEENTLHYLSNGGAPNWRRAYAERGCEGEAAEVDDVVVVAEPRINDLFQISSAQYRLGLAHHQRITNKYDKTKQNKTKRCSIEV